MVLKAEVLSPNSSMSAIAIFHQLKTITYVGGSDNFRVACDPGVRPVRLLQGALPPCAIEPQVLRPIRAGVKVSGSVVRVRDTPNLL